MIKEWGIFKVRTDKSVILCDDCALENYVRGNTGRPLLAIKWEDQLSKDIIYRPLRDEILLCLSCWGWKIFSKLQPTNSFPNEITIGVVLLSWKEAKKEIENDK